MEKRRSSITQFTPEVLPQSDAKRIRNNIIGTLVLLLLLNVAVYFYLENHTTNLAFWLVNEKWRTLQTMEEPLDWVIIGDSSGNQGIVTSKFEEHMNGSAYNYASAAAGVFLNDAWMLETYIQKFGAPKGVVMVHIYDIWPRTEQDWFMAYVPVPISQWDDFALPIDLTLEQRWHVTRLKYMPFYGQRTTIAQLIEDVFWGRSNPFEKPYILEEGGYWRDTRVNSAPPEILARKLRHGTREHIKWTDGITLEVSEVNLASLEYMISLAEKYNFDLYYAISPLHDELYAHENFQGYFLQFQDLLDNYAAKNEHFYNLGLISTFPEDQGLTADHVFHEAALDYTEQLALKILETR